MGSPAAVRETVILIVEDEPLIRMAAMMLIRGLGDRALEAANADEAIVLPEARAEITIGFTDVQMEGSMGSIALTHGAAGRWPPLRFIIVSGGTTPQCDEMPAGAIFLAKPYANAAVRRSIAQFA
ncbi:response regulator [Sphingomonas oryzagri]